MGSHQLCYGLFTERKGVIKSGPHSSGDYIKDCKWSLGVISEFAYKLLLTLLQVSSLFIQTENLMMVGVVISIHKRTTWFPPSVLQILLPRYARKHA